MSYVLYLFHYPLIHNNINKYSVVLKLSIIAYTIYIFIENPIKNINNMFCIYLCSFLLSLFLLKITAKSIKRNKLYKIKAENNNSICSNKLICSIKYNNIQGNIIMLIGDSHLVHYLSIIKRSIYQYDINSIVFLKMWIINVERNYLSLIRYVQNFDSILIIIFSFYVDYQYRYTNKLSFDKSFKYLISNILNKCKGVIIFQDNPHRIRKNDSICKKYLLPVIKDVKITYIDIFSEFCKMNEKCIENIYSKDIFMDMHHLNNDFVCKSSFIYQLFDMAVMKYLVKYKKIYNNISCYEISLLLYNTKYNSFRREYNFSVIKEMSFTPFAFAYMPYFVN